MTGSNESVRAGRGNRLLLMFMAMTVMAIVIFAAGLIAGMMLAGVVGTNNQRPTESEPPAAKDRPMSYRALAGRSPIPQPGETLGTAIKPGEFLDRQAAAAQPPTGIVPWHQADRYMGQTITVEGTVINTHNTGKVCFLNFTRDWHGQFHIVIFAKAMGGWDQPPQVYFLNRKVRATGKVHRYEGRPQIRVNNSSQITIAAAD